MSNNFMSDQAGEFSGAGAGGSWPSNAANTVASVNSAANAAIPTGINTVKGKINSAISSVHLGPSLPPAMPSISSTNPSVPGNTYAHGTGNGNSTNSANYSLNFDPNILDQYDTYTYHWKFFITSLEDTISGNVLNLANQTIIAESGVSDLTIDKVELHGIAVPSIEAGTGTQTLMKFEIVEPSGAGLLDKMYYQAVALGIGNWLVMPCFLQLEFRGRDPQTGDAVVDGGPGSLSGLKWVWPIKLTNAKANVTNVGTRYEFDAIMYDEFAQSNSYFSVQHNITLKGITTLESAMLDLQNKLNADQGRKLIDNYSIPDTYHIVVDPTIAKKSIFSADKTISTYRGSDFVDLDKKSASFNSGTGIDKIVDALCGSMHYFQEKMQNSTTSDSRPNPMTTSGEGTEQMIKLWRVVTETKPIKFDSLRQDNAVAITVFIVEYDLAPIDSDLAPASSTHGQTSQTKRLFQEYNKKHILKKKYNYIFTGLNDQVITLDLNMNFSYAASLSRFGGIYYESQKSDKALKAQDTSKTEADLANQLRELLDFMNESTDTKAVDKKVAEFTAAAKASAVDPSLQDRWSNIIQFQRNPDHLASAAAIAKAGGINRSGRLTDPVLTAKSLAQPQSGTNANGEAISLNFISDINIYSKSAQDAEANQKKLQKSKLRPIVRRENSQETNLTYGIDSSSDAGRARTASVFSTALYSTLDASLQTLKITIKGDPYWLFPRSITGDVTTLHYKSADPIAAIKEIKSSQISDPHSVNLFGTDNFILVRFRTPRIYNLTDDATDPNTEVAAFSGVYRVITIISKFEMGKFTQELSCILDPMIDLQDAELRELLKDIENAVAQPDVISSPSTSPIDNKYIKTDKIMGASQLINGKTTQIASTANQARASIGSIANSIESNIPTITTPSQLVSQTTIAAGKA